ncbi:MAG TPA: efflux RND transporter periplasmic adaptor subunit [Bacteroidales bacterium]|jgi:membrane fusion protein, heavy metal efflux system|nr:efflux RND transporter periplasmic adaptor subunit [Bacteroidales bacterium]MDD4394888.1 efflux RND transporter periplasmic adaptor subunit [Bacteroidales bacterium]HNW68394.1 efflux RND transporter periplasmic adaptor subunit [Bacteroidales bacterium]HPT52612.1 efflux RND transporter periplasmic adaptor subunit [Bacteroidales bacterium]
MKYFAYTLCLVAMLSACTTHHEEEHDEHGDEHEACNLQLTAYNNDFELFAEAAPFVVGKESGILAHFTHINNFKPLESGSVTLLLITGDKQIKQTQKNSTEPGIYQFNITPTQAGKAQLIFQIMNGTDTSTFKLEDVMVYEDEHEAEEAVEHTEISSSTAIQFTKEQSWQTDFATDYPQVIPFGQVIQTVAQVQSAQGEEMVVVAKTNGILQYIAPDIFEGKEVAKSTPLFAVSSNELADNNMAVRLNEAQNNLNLAKQNYDRAKSLVDSKIVSQKEFMEITNAYENAKIVYENLSKNYGSNGERITSPIGGYIKQIMAANGSYVSVGQPIAIVTQNKNLILKADIPQKYAAYLPSVYSANIADPTSDQVYSLEELNGKIVSYGRSVSGDNYMLPVTIEISNTGSFTFGGFVDLWLRTRSSEQATVVPKTALLEEQGNYFVFVQLTPELFEKKEVKIGTSDGTLVEIVSGLSPEQRIVTRGAIMVKLAKASGTLDAHSGHVH